MKKLLLLGLLCCVSFGFTHNVRVESQPQQRKEGGQKIVDFSDENSVFDNFTFYSELPNEGFFVSEGYLCNAGRVESKAILNEPTVLDKFTVEADFHTVHEIASIDSGFFIHASGASDTIDGIRAYNINLEKPAKSNVVTIKIHKFNQSWLGEQVVSTFAIKKSPINLKVDVDNHLVKVYVNHNINPILTYTTDSDYSGGVGFRNFRTAASRINNFKLTSPSIPVDDEKLTAIIEEAEAIDLSKYTTGSVQNFNNALTAARNVELTNQEDVDAAVKQLREAIDNLLLKYTFAELISLIADAEAIIASGEGKYTYNSFGSLKLCVTRAKRLTESSSEDEISTFVQLITNAINNLIAY